MGSRMTTKLEKTKITRQQKKVLKELLSALDYAYWDRQVNGYRAEIDIDCIFEKFENYINTGAWKNVNNYPEFHPKWIEITDGVKTDGIGIWWDGPDVSPRTGDNNGI